MEVVKPSLAIWCPDRFAVWVLRQRIEKNREGCVGVPRIGSIIDQETKAIAFDIEKKPEGHWVKKVFKGPLTHGRRYTQEELWENYTYQPLSTAMIRLISENQKFQGFADFGTLVGLMLRRSVRGSGPGLNN